MKKNFEGFKTAIFFFDHLGGVAGVRPGRDPGRVPQAVQNQRQESEKVLVYEATNPAGTQTSGSTAPVSPNDLPATEPAVGLQGPGREPLADVEKPSGLQDVGPHDGPGLQLLHRRPHLETPAHFSRPVFEAGQVFRNRVKNLGR